jgi:hypothetical protein
MSRSLDAEPGDEAPALRSSRPFIGKSLAFARQRRWSKIEFLLGRQLVLPRKVPRFSLAGGAGSVIQPDEPAPGPVFARKSATPKSVFSCLFPGQPCTSLWRFRLTCLFRGATDRLSLPRHRLISTAGGKNAYAQQFPAHLFHGHSGNASFALEQLDKGGCGDVTDLAVLRGRRREVVGSIQRGCQAGNLAGTERLMKRHSIRSPFEIEAALAYYIHSGNGIAIVKKYSSPGQERPDCDAVQSFAQFRVQILTSVQRALNLNVRSECAVLNSVPRRLRSWL